LTIIKEMCHVKGGHTIPLILIEVYLL
jgi:hypothetical protein